MERIKCTFIHACNHTFPRKSKILKIKKIKDNLNKNIYINMLNVYVHSDSSRFQNQSIISLDTTSSDETETQMTQCLDH